MKVHLYRFLKYCTTLLVLLLLVTNCEQVSDVNIENAQEKKVKSVTLEDFKSNVVNDKSYFKINALFDSNKVEKSITSYGQNDEYTILTDKITLIELDHATTYTFVLIKNNNIEANHFYNLVVHIDDEQSIVKSEIIKYHPTANWFSNPLQEYDGTFEIIENNFLDLSEIFPNEQQISSSCHPQIYGYWECEYGYNHSPDTPGTSCTSWTYYVEITNCSGGGGNVNNGGTNPGSSGNEGNPTDGGGSSSGTGSGSGVSAGTTPTSPTIPEDMEFDEDHLNIQNCIAIQHFGNLNLLSSAQKAIVSDYIDEKGCDNAKSFVEIALEALANDAEVDFDEEIINELDGKALCVYNKLKSLSTDFKTMIQKFDGQFPVAHLKFEMKDLGNTRAETRAPNGAGSSPDYIITIALNNNSNIHGVNYRPNLMTAKTIAHEVIHAEMFRKLLSVLDNGGNIAGITRQNILDALDNNYPGMYNYYRQYKNWQHQQMANHYRSTIADILKKYDNNQHSYQFYMDLAWEGLKYPNIKAWSDLPQSEKNKINKTISDYINSNKNEQCQD